MALELEKLNIVIEGEAKKATAAIDELIAKLNELKATTEALTNVTSQVRSAFRNIASAAKSASKETIKYASDLEQTTHINADVASSSEAVASSILAISGATNTTRQAFQSTSIVLHDMVNQMNAAYSTAIDLYGGLARSQSAQSGMEQLAGDAWDVYEATFSVEDAVDETTSAFGILDREVLMLNAPDEMKNFASQIHQDAELTKSILKSIGGAFGNFVGGITGSINGLLRTIKRVALLRLIRWTIREAVQAVKEGLQILVEWDSTFGNNTSYAAKTVDELKSKWREVEKAIGAAFMPLIQIAKPILDGIMNAVIWLANGLNQILRSAQGFSTYMKATYISTSKTTKEAKELRRTLFGFDELNVLNGNGGTGAAGSISPFEYIETEIDEDHLRAGRRWRMELEGIKTAVSDTKKQFKDAWAETKEGAAELLGHLKQGWEDIKVGVSLAADFTSSQFADAWAESKEGAAELVQNLTNGWESVKKAWGTFRTWFAQTFVIPVKEAFADAGEWIIEKFPGLAKIFGITKEKIDKIRLDIEAITKPDKETNELESVVLAVGTLGVNIATKTKLDNNIKDVIGLVGSNLISMGMSISLGKFASGGSPDMGTLFYAGEQGAEIVANSSNGTGVMNVKQMQDAVSNGNAQVVNTLGAIANVIVRAINEKDTNAYLDGRIITDTVAKQMNNRVRATGKAVIVG